jgi:hypothetical protein
MTRYHRSHQIRGYLADGVEHINDPRARYDMLALIAALGITRDVVTHWLAVLRDAPPRGARDADLWRHRVTSWILVACGAPVYDPGGVRRRPIAWPSGADR